jgi:hypothetical protein
MELRALLCVACLLAVEKEGSDWVGRPGLGFFSQLQILKSLKSCVLKLRILQELEA